MQSGEFKRRFDKAHEIARDATETYLLIFYDNGSELGLWRQHHATAQNAGEVLCLDDAATARYWYSQEGLLTFSERARWLDRLTNTELSADPEA